MTDRTLHKHWLMPVVFLLVPVVWQLFSSSFAQQPPDPRISQLQRGIAVFELECARCHDFNRVRTSIDMLATRIGPKELAWHGTTESLFRYVSDYMPFDTPGSLEESDYLDVLAFLLYRAELLPADFVLTMASLPEVGLPPYSSFD